MKKTKEISLLTNSIYYFIECVFILRLHNRFRLVALHHGTVLTDECYRTLKGARIAFAKKYKKKAWDEQVKAEWSLFYDPDDTAEAEKVKASISEALPIPPERVCPNVMAVALPGLLSRWR